MSCDRRNPIRRSGIAQPGRCLAAFDPLHFRIDDRDLPGMVLYGREHAELLKFPDPSDAAADPPASWLPFFGRDPISTMASLVHLPVGDAARCRSRLEDLLRESETISDLGPGLLELFRLPVLLLRELDRQCVQLRPEHPFSRTIEQLVASRKVAFLAWIRIYKRVVEDADWFEDVGLDSVTEAPSRVVALASRFPEPLSEVVLESRIAEAIAPDGWVNWYEGLDPDPSALVGVDAPHNVRALLSHNLFRGALNALLELFARVAREAHRAFDATKSTPGHEPAYSLYLAFLQVFERHRQAANDLTRRHREYYYREILQLSERAEQPDRVHLVLEATKTAKPTLVEQGTVFDAGKDGSGRDIRFLLDDDIVLNQGRVARLCGQWAKEEREDELVPWSSTAVDQRDEEPVERWNAFGATAGATAARIGLAMSDPILFAREGQRVFTVTITLVESLLEGHGLPATVFYARLTGEEGWIEHEATTSVDSSRKVLTVIVTLSGEVGSVVPHDSDLHGEVSDARHPVLQVVLDPGENRVGTGWKTLAGMKVATVEVMLEANGIRNVRVQNDYGLVDTSKPFDLFGPLPANNSSFYIGSSEALSKKLAKLGIAMTYESAYSNTGYFKRRTGESYGLEAHQLVAGEWISAGAEHALFEPEGQVVFSKYFLLGNLSLAAALYFDEAVSSINDEIVDVAGMERSLTDDGPTPFVDNDPPGLEFEREVMGGGAGRVSAADTKRYRLAITIEPEMNDPVGSVEQTSDNPLFEASSRDGFIRFRLDGGDFGHSKYPVEQSLALVAATQYRPYAMKPAYNYDPGIPMTMMGAKNLPKPPYTPRVTSLSIGYETKKEKPAQLWELTAFGARLGNGDGQPALHVARNDDDRGELAIGVEGFVPPARLNLLFRVAEGTASPDRSPARLQWDYLGPDGWVPLEAQQVDDRTHGLTTTGLVSLALPEDAVRGHSIMALGLSEPPALHWVRLSTADPVDAVANLVQVLAQGVSATYAPAGNDRGRIEARIPAETITRPKPSLAVIKKVKQPDPSFGGRPTETADQHAQRTSERLRHKNRAVTMWDYERLVLERFPEIYKVKCINHARLERDINENVVADNEMRPGSVVVVPIPYVDPLTADPRRPYARTETLEEIGLFLRERTSPFVRLEVCRPKIEEIHIELDAEFVPEIQDFGFYKQRLAAAIADYLNPWSGSERIDISFGGRLDKSSVIDFVEELDYIDHVENVEMHHYRDISKPSDPANTVDHERIFASSARSVLVSHAEHIIGHLVRE